MPIINRLAEVQDEIAEWRRDIHRHPELLYDVQRTAGLVADRLKEFGVDEVVTGIGRTGVVGVIRGRRGDSNRVIGLRADMDALPIEEATGKPYASEVKGKMHACGHDGHTAMLLGAARHLSETRNFDGTAIVIFQPAEEGGAGGKAMVDDGLMDRFGIQEVYGMHNLPGLAAGHFATRPGPLLASTDEFKIEIAGRGGHAAFPHETIDPIVAGAAVVQALQSIVARNVKPVESAVVSVTRFNAGTGSNIIPDIALLTGTVRTLQPHVRDQVEMRLREVVERTASAYGATATLRYKRNYPVTVNHVAETKVALRAAADVAGPERTDANMPPLLGAEDFAYMLEARPGAFVFIGNGDSAGLHSPSFDFNDEIIPAGCSYWVRLVETALPA